MPCQLVEHDVIRAGLDSDLLRAETAHLEQPRRERGHVHAGRCKQMSEGASVGRPHMDELRRCAGDEVGNARVTDQPPTIRWSAVSAISLIRCEETNTVRPWLPR
jgi:hypothetical protein